MSPAYILLQRLLAWSANNHPLFLPESHPPELQYDFRHDIKLRASTPQAKFIRQLFRSNAVIKNRLDLQEVQTMAGFCAASTN